MTDRAQRAAARAVLRDAQSRALAPLSLPLAAVHGARFLECLGRDDAGVERVQLWGPGAADGEQRVAHAEAARQRAQDLPTRYAHQNARCVRCAVPLIPGYSVVHRGIPRRRSAPRAKAIEALCTHCGARQAQPCADPAGAAFPPTRQRRAQRAEILQGKVKAPGPAAEVDRAPAPVEREPRAELAPAPPKPAPPVSPLEERARQLKAKRKQERTGPGTTSGAAPAPPSTPTSAAPRRPPTAHRDTKAGLRALLAQRQQSGRPAPGGQKPGRRGLADLLEDL